MNDYTVIDFEPRRQVEPGRLVSLIKELVSKYDSGEGRQALPGYGECMVIASCLVDELRSLSQCPN